MRIIYATLFFALFCSFGAVAQVLVLKANNDVATTGPLQTVKKDVVANDIVPCNNHEISIPVTSTLNASLSSYGAADVRGDNIVFAPNAACINTVVPIIYVIRCGLATDTATLTITVAENNNPVNIIDEYVACFKDMPVGVAFTPALKYIADNRSTKRPLDGFSMPLVGDLNGDGKPEIVALGLYSGGTGLAATAGYIEIFNGQTGAFIYEHSLTNFVLRYEPRHNSVSKLAIADLDPAGLNKDNNVAEIILTNSIGSIYCFRPVYTGQNITGMTTVWSHIGTAASGTNDGFKKPINNTGYNVYGSPVPFIADINGDGKPEVIVYNKIYDGKTGNLLETLEELNNFDYTTTAGANGTSGNSQIHAKYAFVGRRPGAYWNDDHIPCMSTVDIDGDGILDIVAGSKVYKMKNNNGVPKLDYIIHGPTQVTARRGYNNSADFTCQVNDGFTAVADIDGNGWLDVVVFAPAEDNLDNYTRSVVYVWEPVNNDEPSHNPATVKAATYLYTSSYTGTFSHPFIGDINGRNDNFNNSKKLPEICMNTGRLWARGGYSANPGDTYAGSKIKVHPLSTGIPSVDCSNCTFNSDNSGSIRGHILAFTYNADPNGSTPMHERLKLSWVMEHNDESSCTGITMFDFDNDGIMELCYRDETTLRIISPGGKTPAGQNLDYIKNTDNETNLPGIIRLKQKGVRSYTGFEAPVIADVNMDGSADIITLASDIALNESNTSSTTASRGYVYVFQNKAGTQKWSPAPPVWNQAFYFPLLINENLTVLPKPISMLTPFTDGAGNTIQPYNGHWLQRAIVRNNAPSYDPIVRQPNAVITNMKVTTIGTTSVKIELTVKNIGSATIASGSIIKLYNGGYDGYPLNHTSIQTMPDASVPVDIFPNEKSTFELSINGNYDNKLLYACIMVDKDTALLPGYDDCDRFNNIMDGIYCSDFGYTITAVNGSPTVCGVNGTVELEANYNGTNSINYNYVSYQWYWNDNPIAGAINHTYTATRTGIYKCYIKQIPPSSGVCRGFSSELEITYRKPDAKDDYIFTTNTSSVKIAPLANDNITDCAPLTIGLVNGGNTVGSSITTLNGGTATIITADSILYTPDNMFTGIDEFKYHINGEDTAIIHVYINTPHVGEYYACAGASVIVGFANVTTGMTLKLYNNDGSAVSGGTLTTAPYQCSVQKDGSDVQRIWVEATLNGTLFNNRLEVRLKLSDGCNGIPAGCAVTGSLLWREDFGGNAAGDSRVSSSALSSVSTGYSFQTANNAAPANSYWLLKYNDFGNSNQWHTKFSDHTHAADTSRGYMFMSVAGNNAVSTVLYERDINELCSGASLYFSVYVANLTKSNIAVTSKPSLRFELAVKDQNNNEIILATFSTDTIAREADKQLKWHFYGFPFTMPAAYTSAKIRIYNNTPNTQIVMDDIEIRMCADPIDAKINGKLADTLCLSQIGSTNPVLSVATFTDSNGALITSGSSAHLTGEWQESATGDINDNWIVINTVNGSSGNNFLAGSTFVPSGTFTASTTVYYRYVIYSSSNSTNNLCRAASPVMSLTVYPALNAGTVSLLSGVKDTSICTTSAAPQLKQTAATGGEGAYSGAYSYQWQESDGTGSVPWTWNDMTDATATSPLLALPSPSHGVKYYRRVVRSSCGDMHTDSVKITVKQTPAINDSTVTICSGATFNVTPADGQNGNTVPLDTKYTWSAPSGINISGQTSGSNSDDIIQTLTNTSSNSENIEYTVTATANGCSETFKITVTVNPQSGLTLTSPTTIGAVCSGDSIRYDAESNTLGATFSWTRTAPIAGITPAAGSTGSGSDARIREKLYNSTDSPITVNYLITLSFGSGATACINTITVPAVINPKPVIHDTAITICSGSQFIVTPQNGYNNDTVPTATTYKWEVSVANGNISGATDETAVPQNSISQTLYNLTNTAQNITYTVTPNSGSCVGDKTFDLTVTVEPKTVIHDTTLTICSGSAFDATPQNGVHGDTIPSCTKYSWRIGTFGEHIEGAEEEDDYVDAISQTLVNNGDQPESVVYLVFPAGCYSSCSASNSFEATVTVNPVVTVDPIENTTVCSGGQVSAVNFSSPSGSSVSYSWTNDNTAIGLPASGTGNIGAFYAATNAGTFPLTATIKVTPFIDDSCAGRQDSFKITVRPVAVYSDIRIMLCPAPFRNINLNCFIDTLYSQNIEWHKTASSSPDITLDGKLETNGFKSGTHVYSYSVNNGCDISSGKVYIKTLSNSSTVNTIPDTVAICKDIYAAQFINLNRMFGLEISGDWILDPSLVKSLTPPRSDYVSEPVAPSKFAGAEIFDGKKAFEAAGVGTVINYHGDTQAKMFEFKYEPHGNCLSNNQPHKIIVVITDRIVP
jgi:hypothetical protein